MTRNNPTDHREIITGNSDDRNVPNAMSGQKIAKELRRRASVSSRRIGSIDPDVVDQKLARESMIRILDLGMRFVTMKQYEGAKKRRERPSQHASEAQQALVAQFFCAPSGQRTKLPFW